MSDRDDLLWAFAKHQYMYSKLVTLLIEKGHVSHEEIDSLYDESEYSEFLRDFLEFLRKGDEG